MAIKTLFVGSNWEALEALRTLNEDDRFEIVGVITQPDKPVGRKQIMTQNEVKQYALSNDISVYHTESDERKYAEAIEIFKPELIVCKSFGEIIPEFFLEAPKYKSINVHFSILPKYRGAIPIQKAIMDGEKSTGISIVKMVAKLDAGPVLATFPEDIRDDDTNLSLRQRLVKKCTEVIGDVLFDWCNGKIDASPQEDSEATFCWQREISKENAEIRFEIEEPSFIERKVRALIPWPVAWCWFQNKRLKLFGVKVINDDKHLNPGEFSKIDDRLFVGSNEAGTILELTDVQLEGKNRMSGEEFVRGTKTKT